MLQHLRRLAEAHLDAGERETAEERLATARARVATMSHMEGFRRVVARLDLRFQGEALRVRP